MSRRSGSNEVFLSVDQPLRTGNRRLIAELNTALVLNCIRESGPIPRNEVAQRLGLGRSTVTGIVRRLIDDGLVRSTGSGASKGGRRPEMLAFVPERYAVAGLKLQPGAVLGCLTDLNGAIQKRCRVPLAAADEKSALAGVSRAFGILTDGIGADDVLGCGLALPGIVDAVSGVSVDPHFFAWSRLPLKERLESAFKVPVMIENDARAAAVGELWCGRGKRLSNFIFLSIGIGVGGSIVLNEQLVTGDVPGAGHLGHTLVEPDGPVCHCGQRGCLDVMANDEALLRYLREAADAFPSSALAGGASIPAAFEAAGRRDPAAMAALDKLCSYLGTALSNAVKTLGVCKIIVGGETGALGGSLLAGRLADHTRERLFDEMAAALEVTPTPLGDDVWMVGAAALILDAAFQPPIWERGEEAPLQVARAAAAADDA